MKPTSLALAMLFAFWAHAQAQTNPVTGMWQVEAQQGGTLALKADGSTVTGTVSAGVGQAVDISDGKIDGTTVSFKVQFPNGGRTVSFTGTVKGDEIQFTREVNVPQGAVPGGVGLLGLNGPASFTASRMMAESLWTGTVRNAPTPRNPDPPPNPRAVSLGTKRVAAPHWLWRGGPKQMEVRTFTHPMGTFELSLFELDGDRLAFSYTRQNGDETSCTLTRRPEGQFQGTCQLGGGTNTQLIELIPPGLQKPVEAANTTAR